MSGAKMVTRLFAGTFVSLAIGVLAGAGVASASGEDDYINDLDNSHIDGPRATLLQVGYQACLDRLKLVSRPDAIQAIQNSTNLNHDQADFLYTSALRNLCGR